MAVTADTKLDPRIPHRLAVDVDAGEADKLEAYWDDIGKVWTIGRGHVLPQAAPGHSWAGFTIPQSTSDLKFNGDLLAAMAFAEKWPEFPACDTECRRNALYEIAFNLRGRWSGFHKARAAITAQDWQAAHDNMLWNAPDVKTPWYEQIGHRAERIAGYILTGEYPS